jgi:predicted AlkP superfamily pyrophosphatase or phosphodiesterase
MRKLCGWSLVVGFIVNIVACSGQSSSPSSSPPTTTRAKYALVIGIDGARPDAVQKANTPALDQLAATGASTFQATTQLKAPTLSAPGWASILTGVDADKHLMVANEGFENRNQQYPSFLWRAQHAGKPVFLAPAWIGILQLTESEKLEHTAWGGDPLVTKLMTESLQTSDNRVFFIHYDAVDHAGHATGFSPDNPEYIQAIEGVDSQLVSLVQTIHERPNYDQEDWLIVATTDHGGEGTSHGAQNAVNQTIWVILNGPDIQKGTLPQASQMDIHPTLLHHMDIPYSDADGLDGHVIGQKNLVYPYRLSAPRIRRAIFWNELTERCFC